MEERLQELEGRLQAVYTRILEGDPVAPAEFAEVVVEEYGGRGSLINAMRSSVRISDLDEAKAELSSIVGLFVAEFLKDPFKYDPDRSPLGHYIQLALKGDVLNEADKQRRIEGRRADPPDDDDGTPDQRVEEAARRWNPQMTPEDQVLDQIELTDEERSKAMAFIDSLAPDERACFELLSDGVRETEPYADALGISHLAIETQRTTVNRIKDRLKKKVQRLR